MKKTMIFLALALVAVSSFGDDVKERTRSRNLTQNQPTSGYYLGTDGKWNSWRQFSASSTVTVSKQTGAITASGANDLVTFTNYFNPVNQTVSLTDTNGVTALVVTNVSWSTAVYTVATNGVVSVNVTGGSAVVTNATATAVTTIP
jgi:uncharacterized protein YdeI (BOF family)